MTREQRWVLAITSAAALMVALDQLVVSTALNAILGHIGSVIEHAPVLITQHMPPTFTAILAEHLARVAGCPVHEGTDGEAIQAGFPISSSLSTRTMSGPPKCECK